MRDCPRCGESKDWNVYADSDVSRFPYQSDMFRGIGIWCVKCHDFVVPVICQSDLEELVQALFNDGVLDKYLEGIG